MEKGDLFQEKSPIMDKSKCPDVFTITSLFTNRFFEELLSLVKSVMEISSSDYIDLNEIGFVQDWQAILNFFIFPELCSVNGFVKADIEGTYIIRKISPGEQYVYDAINSENIFNILVPLSSGGDINFRRYYGHQNINRGFAIRVSRCLNGTLP